MLQIYFHQNQNVLHKLRICRCNFTVKLGTLPQPGKSGFISSENLFQSVAKKEFFAMLLEWKLFQTSSYFRTACAILALEKIGI